MKIKVMIGGVVLAFSSLACINSALAGSTVASLPVEISGPNNSSLIIQAPDGRIAINKPNEAPYCAIPHSCDLPIDCYGNSPGELKPGNVWQCHNKPQICKGVCYQISVSDAARKNILATIVEGEKE